MNSEKADAQELTRRSYAGQNLTRLLLVDFTCMITTNGELMKRRLSQLVLCGLIFAGWLNAALAQKMDFAAAARAATEGGQLDQAYPKITPGMLETMRNKTLNRLPQAQRPGFLSHKFQTPEEEAGYYEIVNNCIDQEWRRNCG